MFIRSVKKREHIFKKLNLQFIGITRYFITVNEHFSTLLWSLRVSVHHRTHADSWDISRESFYQKLGLLCDGQAPNSERIQASCPVLLPGYVPDPSTLTWIKHIVKLNE